MRPPAGRAALRPRRLAPALERDRVTVLAYLMLGAYGYFLNALGPALPALRRELELSRAEAGLHSTLVAAGLVVAGLVGDRVSARLGRRRGLWLAAAGLGAGAVVLALGRTLALTLGGAALMGVAGALLPVLVPALLSDRHGALRAAAISEANAVSSTLGAAAPFAVALAIVAGGDWRPAVLVAAVVGLPLIGLRYRSLELPEPARRARDERRRAARLPAAYWARWLSLFLFVSAEFCLVFWATDYLEAAVGLEPAPAAALASLFLVGMAAGRFAGGRLAQLPGSERLLTASPFLALPGFLLFWAAPTVALAALGLAAAGLGIALLYPLTLALAIDSAPGSGDRASARAALGSGLAVSIAPFALAWTADRTGLTRAFAIVPAVLVAGWLAGRLASRLRAAGR